MPTIGGNSPQTQIGGVHARQNQQPVSNEQPPAEAAGAHEMQIDTQ
jgi:hypothetical protein